MRDRSGRVQYKRPMESYAPSISSGPLLIASLCLETTPVRGPETHDPN